MSAVFEACCFPPRIYTYHERGIKGNRKTLSVSANENKFKVGDALQYRSLNTTLTAQSRPWSRVTASRLLRTRAFTARRTGVVFTRPGQNSIAFTSRREDGLHGPAEHVPLARCLSASAAHPGIRRLLGGARVPWHVHQMPFGQRWAVSPWRRPRMGCRLLSVERAGRRIRTRALHLYTISKYWKDVTTGKDNTPHQY